MGQIPEYRYGIHIVLVTYEYILVSMSAVWVKYPNIDMVFV